MARIKMLHTYITISCGVVIKTNNMAIKFNRMNFWMMINNQQVYFLRSHL